MKDDLYFKKSKLDKQCSMSKNMFISISQSCVENVNIWDKKQKNPKIYLIVPFLPPVFNESMTLVFPLEQTHYLQYVHDVIQWPPDGSIKKDTVKDRNMGQ